MLRLFRSNSPPAILLLISYGLVLKLKLLWLEHPLLTGRFSPLSQEIFLLLKQLHEEVPWGIKMLAIALVIGQAFYLNTILVRYKFIPRQSVMAAGVYLLFSSLIDGFLLLSPILLATTFVIAATGKLMEVFNRDRCDRELFESGLYIGLASLLYPPFILLVFFQALSFFVVRSSSFREFMVGISGIVVPLFLTGTAYFWVDQLTYFIRYQFIWLPVFKLLEPVINLPWVVKMALFMLALIASLVYMQRYYTISLIKIRRYTQLFILLLLFTSFVIPFMFASIPPDSFDFGNLFAVMVPVTAVISYSWYHQKESRLNEILHLLLFAVILLTQYITFEI